MPPGIPGKVLQGCKMFPRKSGIVLQGYKMPPGIPGKVLQGYKVLPGKSGTILQACKVSPEIPGTFLQTNNGLPGIFGGVLQVVEDRGIVREGINAMEQVLETYPKMANSGIFMYSQETAI